MLRCLGIARGKPATTVAATRVLVVPQRNLFVLNDDAKKQRITRRQQEKFAQKQKKNKQAQATPKKSGNSTEETEEYKQKRYEEIRKGKFSELRSLVSHTAEALYNKSTVEVNDDYIDSTAKVIYDQVKPKFDPERATISPKPIPSPKEGQASKPLELPEPITDRLGLAPSFLVNDTNQNWPVLLNQLQLGGGFQDLQPGTIHKFLRKIPNSTLVNLIPSVEAMYSHAGIEIPHKTYYLFLRALASGHKVSDERLKLVQHYVDLIKQQVTDLSVDHYETLLVIYSKSDDFTRVNQILQEMKQRGIQVSKPAFSAIMQGYIYNQRNHTQAMEVFDGMKFFSQMTQPGEKEYTEIIASCVMNDELERGLDLYQEMISNKIPINQKVLSNLAKGCCRKPQYRHRAWQLFFDIYKHGWVPDLPTYESMIYIAARDGDVDLARALLYKMLETNSVTPKALAYLILSYSKFVPPSERTTPLAILHNEKGLQFRRKIIDEIDYSTIVAGFPFLPNARLTNRTLILAESSAVWAYITLSCPQFISSKLATSYLDIALEQGNFEDFKHRFESATYLDATGLPQTRQIVIEEPESATATSEIANNDTTKDIAKSPLLNEVEHLFKDNRAKAPRDCIMYMVAVRAAGRFKNFDFLDSIIKERGQYRKSAAFQQLPAKTRHKLDFSFATVLVDSYTKMNMLEDALAVVIASEDQFLWGKKELGNLMGASYKIENFHVIDRLREVIGKSQIAKGKITRLDHKIYVKKRGY
ncbi:uncharacterized protein SPAPADRAFT_157751 [Spathaspora passalidarum NRRL Y-27907]|uniref:Mitochondrial 15S rRNA processing factor CCM1 n=1 Tax=Spathaspora passalidarum (strain NRRL Y-27907 / 11-Y1) TaxID=619300 RepID=G3AUK2_SPAPN|nr:uncharacterized protein SPAPADRAFT_157751 [Spathaspora passalidarum NRRL Y-27907]EGW30558.1 hypothetical protein SPAPADRAFT_157751 [Spathaspora passalidarum NRRL Y-27907]